MTTEKITLRARDGECTVHVATPSTGTGPWPAAIIYMDAVGIRPTLVEMGQRLADAGYVVLVPDLFYRSGPYGPLVPKEVFKSGFREVVGPLMAATGNDKAAQDTAAFLAYLDTRTDVAGRKVGAVGFCMGGGMAIAAAGSYPDRFAAVASFHGGNLATDAPTSPHLLVPRVEAEVYIGAADNDGSYPPAMAERMEKALSDAGVRFTAETYAGAHHGWMKPDFPVYDHDAAERGWVRLLDLFKRNLPA